MSVSRRREEALQKGFSGRLALCGLANSGLEWNDELKMRLQEMKASGRTFDAGALYDFFGYCAGTLGRERIEAGVDSFHVIATYLLYGRWPILPWLFDTAFCLKEEHG